MEGTQPDVHRLWLGVALMVAMLTAMGIVRMVVDRVLAPNDPRRRFIGPALLYGSTAIFLLLMLWLRR